MMIFWLSLLLLAVTAALLIAIPTATARARRNTVREALNVQLFQQRRDELEADKLAGRLHTDEFEALHQELERNFLRDMTVEAQADQHSSASDKKLVIGVFLFIPIVALVLYQQFGYRPVLDEWQATQQRVNPQIDKLIQGTLKPEDLASIPPQQFIQALQARAQRTEDDPKLWFVLGNALLQISQDVPDNKQVMLVDSATKALRRAYSLAPNEPEHSNAYMQALLSKHGGRYVPESRKIMATLLASKTNYAANLMAHGMASFRSEEYQQAIDAWQTLLQLKPNKTVTEQAGSEAFAQARHIIERSIQRARTALQSQQAANAVVPKLVEPKLVDPKVAASEPAEQQGGSLFKITIKLGDQVPEMKQGFLMVYAQAQEGPPMPLAIKKIPLPLMFPYHLELTDADAMISGMTLSRFPKVKLTARLTPSGMAVSQKGDWVGTKPEIVTGMLQTVNITVTTPF